MKIKISGLEDFIKPINPEQSYSEEQIQELTSQKNQKAEWTSENVDTVKLQQVDNDVAVAKKANGIKLISAVKRLHPDEKAMDEINLIASSKQQEILNIPPENLISPISRCKVADPNAVDNAETDINDDTAIDAEEVQEMLRYKEQQQIPKKNLKSVVARIKKPEQKTGNLNNSVYKPNPLTNFKNANFYSGVGENIELPMTKYQQVQFTIENFSYHDGMLFYIDEAMREIKIANCWLQIVAENDYIQLLGDLSNRVADTEVTAKWKVRIFCSRRWFDVEMSRAELENGKLLNEKTLGRAKIDKPALFSEFIGRLIDREEYKIQYFYQTTGWIFHPQYNWIYITNDGPIGIPGTDCYANVLYDFVYNRNTVKTQEIFQAFWNMRCICSGAMENSIFLMHFACLATMASLFQHYGFPISFITALVGSTNSMKTSCAKIFTRSFQGQGSSGVDIRFSSTKSAIEEVMDTYGDAILTIDDYLPYEDKTLRHAQQEKLDTVIRSYGDHEPRKRSRQYAKINEVSAYTPIRGCCLITGETIDFYTESSATRVVRLAFERGQVDINKLSFYQENPLILPTFLYDYICYIREHIQDIEKVIKNSIETARISCTNIITPRYKDTFGVMFSGVSIFYRYAVERGFLDINTADAYSKEDIRMIEKIIIQNDRNVKETSPASTICLALERAIREGNIPVIAVCDAEMSCELTDSVVDDGEFLRIYPETLCNLYIQYCKSTGRNIIYRNGKELHSPLKKEKLLLLKEASDGIRATHKIKGKSEKRFFFIRKEELNRFTDYFNNF